MTNMITQCTCKIKFKKITPIGVCVGPGCSIFVCSKDTHSLVQVSAPGRVLGSYILYMKYPSTVCISKDGKKLAVFNCDVGNV